VAEKIDIATLKEDLAKRERERQAAEEQRLSEQRKARLDKQAQDEIKRRERRIADLEKSKGFLQRQITQLTEGGRISNEKQLRDAIEGYNASIELQEELSGEASEIAKGNYTIQGDRLVVALPARIEKPSITLGPTTPAGGRQQREEPIVRQPEVRQEEQKTGQTQRDQQRKTGQTPPPKVKEKGGKEKPLTIQEIYDQARSIYTNVDSIFLYEPELRQLLRKAVEEDYEPTRFTAELAATDWAKRGATVFRNREAEKREYTEQLGKLEKQLELAVNPEKQSKIREQIDELKTQSAYARGLAKARGTIQNIITSIGARYTPDQVDLLVKRIYDSASESDVNKITDIVAGNIGYADGTVLGGASGQYLQDLRSTAKANGIDFDKVYKNNINDWLGRLAQGESVETYKNLIRQQAKMGLPDRIASMLDQGLDLEQIYAPYKSLMASYLEIPAQNIDLNDRTLRMAIGPEKEMTLYDFERSLKNDPRWEYTNNAREEVSSNVLSVLRSFGFQG
jgi:hypothetical protein